MTDSRSIIRAYCQQQERGEIARDSMLEKLALFWKACHAGFIRIRYRDGRIGPLTPNEGQARVHAKAMQMAAAGKPVRLSILKGRKIGVSTWWQAFGVFLVWYWPASQCKTLAHVAESTMEIFGIAKLVAKEFASVVPTEPTENGVKNPANGSWYRCYTAGGEAVGAGGTPTLLHRSEVAFWKHNKAENDKSSGESVPYDPNTIIVDESTANGRELFFTRFCDAASPEHPFEPVFLAWYIGDDNAIPIERPLTLDDDELFIQRRARADGIEISHEAFAWRRMKIQEIGIGDFRQQHPSTPEEAVMGSKGLIVTGLRDCLIPFDRLPFDPSLMLPASKVGSIDFGFEPDPCVIGSGYWYQNSLYVTRIWRRHAALHSEQIAGLEDGHTYYCDPANLSDRKNLAAEASKAGLKCRFGAAPRRKHPGEECVKTELKLITKLIREQRLWIVGTDASGHVPPGVAQLIVEADTYAWNEKTGKPDDSRSDEVGHYDTMDMLRYMCMGVMQYEREPVKAKAPAPLTRRQQMMRSM